jgi:hypothetical protein
MAELSKMIKRICSERQISRNSNSGYSWGLPILDPIKYENDDSSTHLGNSPAALLYKHEVADRKWKCVQELSTSRSWMVSRICFNNSGVQKLLLGKWLDDDVIDAYLELCGYLRPDMKFISTHWFPFLSRLKPNESIKSVPWVSLPFHLH